MNSVIRGAHRSAIVILPACAAWFAAVMAVYYGVRLRQLFAGSIPRQDAIDFFEWPAGTGFPFATEAALGAATGGVAAVVLLACAFLVGSAIGRIAGLRFENYRERAAIGVVLGIVFLVAGAMALSSVGAYRQPGLLGFAVLAAAASVVILLSDRFRRPAKGGVGMDRLQPGVLLWGGLIIAATGVSLFAALSPETEYDAVWYHLFFPRLFLEAGRLRDFPLEPVSLYPMAWEVWLGYGLAMGGDRVAKLLNFACLPLTTLLVFEAARRFGGRGSAWVAAGLFVTVPTVMWEASTTYIDLALGLSLTLCAYAICRFLDERKDAWLFLSGLSLGLALATKHLTMLFALPAALILVAAVARVHGVSPSALRAVACFVAPAALLALPWYIRSWVATGNPVFPYFYGIFGAPSERWNAVTQAGFDSFYDKFGSGRSWINLLLLPWDMTMHAVRYGGSLGPAYLALMPIIAFARETKYRGRRREAIRIFSVFTAAYLALWASPLSSFQIRFVVPVVPLLAVLTAAGFARIRILGRRSFGRRVATIPVMVLAVLLFLNLPPFTGLHERDRNGWLDWLIHVPRGLPLVVLGAESRDAYLERKIPTYAAWNYANAHLPADTRVLAYSQADEYYACRDKLSAASPALLHLVFSPVSEAEEARRKMHELGVTHLMMDKKWLITWGLPDTATWDGFALTRSEVRRNEYELVYEDDRAVLYAIPPMPGSDHTKEKPIPAAETSRIGPCAVKESN
jgi:hypothetical protein